MKRISDEKIDRVMLAVAEKHTTISRWLSGDPRLRAIADAQLVADKEDCVVERQAARQEVVDWVKSNLVDEKHPIPVGDSVYLRFRPPIEPNMWQVYKKNLGVK